MSSYNMWDEFSATSENVLFICAPNFESRSLSSIFDLAQYRHQFEVSKNMNLVVGMVTFQASQYRVEPLEDLKRQNVSAAESLFRKEGWRLVKETVPYPDPDKYSWRVLEQCLSRIFEQTSDRFHIVLDISAIPTRVISDTLTILQEASRSEVSQYHVQSIHIAYSSPAAYPKPRYPTASGEPMLIRAEQSVTSITSRCEHVNLAILIGDHGFQSQRLVNSLPANSNVALFAFMNQANILYSMEVLRANTALFFGSHRSYMYLTAAHGHEKIVNWAHDVEIVEGGVNLIAPLGPRPMTVSAWTAVQILRERIMVELGQVTVGSCDIVRYQYHHYASSYSLGKGKTEYYSVHLNDLHRPSLEHTDG